jgi:hypothetical protein
VKNQRSSHDTTIEVENLSKDCSFERGNIWDEKFIISSSVMGWVLEKTIATAIVSTI